MAFFGFLTLLALYILGIIHAVSAYSLILGRRHGWAVVNISITALYHGTIIWALMYILAPNN